MLVTDRMCTCVMYEEHSYFAACIVLRSYFLVQKRYESVIIYNNFYRHCRRHRLSSSHFFIISVKCGLQITGEKNDVNKNDNDDSDNGGGDDVDDDCIAMLRRRRRIYNN